MEGTKEHSNHREDGSSVQRKETRDECEKRIWDDRKDRREEPAKSDAYSTSRCEDSRGDNEGKGGDPHDRRQIGKTS